MLGLTGFLGLTRIPLCFWAHTDSTLLLGSHRSHRSHGIALWVGNLTDASACELARADSALLLGSHGSHRSHGIALWVGNLTDVSACVDLCGLRWGHIALALTDLFFGPFGQIGHF